MLEANPRRAGGALGTEELTLPGFRHDVGAGFFPFAASSPAFVDLDLPSLGLEWRHAAYESCHPALDGSVAVIARADAIGAAPFGSPRDAQAFAELARFHAGIERELLAVLLGPFPSVRPLLRLGLRKVIKVARMLASSPRRLASRLFESEAARRVLPGLGLHVGVGPDDTLGAALGYVLALTATTGGFAVPVGGAHRVVEAMTARLAERGGTVRLGARVARIIVRDKRACAVQLDDGTQIAAPRAILGDTSAAALLLSMVGPREVPSWVRSFMGRFPQGWGTFKVDWALSGAVPWQVESASESAVVHAGENLDDLARFAAKSERAAFPERPYLVIGQQTSPIPAARRRGNRHSTRIRTCPRSSKAAGPRRASGSLTRSSIASRGWRRDFARGFWDGI